MLEYSKSYGMCIVLIYFGKKKLYLNFIYHGDSEMSMSNCFSVIVLFRLINAQSISLESVEVGFKKKHLRQKKKRLET